MKSPTPLTATLARRIREIRSEVFGEGRSGLEAVAAELSLPTRNWENYEAGVTMPATVLVHFLALTGANPLWLMNGSGERYLPQSGTPPERGAGASRCRMDRAGTPAGRWRG